MHLKQKQSLMLLLVAALLVLLPLLAVLQYRWLGEVSAGERERMQSLLKTSTERFSADFDRELTNAYVQLQGTSPELSGSSESVLIARYRRWGSASEHAKLVREIYRVLPDETGQLALQHFDQSSNTLAPAEWPENLKGLRDRFNTQQQTRQSAEMIFRSVLGANPEQLQNKLGRGFVFQITLGQIADDVPALVVPDASGHFPPASLTAEVPSRRAYTVAVLDLNYIKNELLPELARRYFTTDGASEYNLAIIRRGDSKEVIYQTDAHLPISAFEQSDAKAGLFKIRPDEVDRVMVLGGVSGATVPQAAQHIAAPAASSDQKNTDSATQEKNSRVAISVMQSDINIKKSAGSNADQAQSIHEQIEGALPTSLPRQITKRVEDGSWQLLVKHRAGSLDAAVGNVRRRNLGISFGILLLLGVSVGLIVMSSRRAQRLATQQMEFVAGVSHELRTPLAVICSAAENLADGVPGLIDNRDQIKRYGGLIRDEGRRLTGMVEQVLEFAGAQSGKKTYELRTVEPQRVIEDALAACHLPFVEGGFELEAHIPADLPMIKADAAALSRAIQNLLNNAMKYSGDSRWIGLRAGVIKTDRGDQVQIEVSDRGLGIPPSELPHIFEPFYRGKEVVASQIHGNGLGLSLVKHIVEAHGGQVNVESKLGQGSEFRLHLPNAGIEEPSTSSARNVYEQTNFAR